MTKKSLTIPINPLFINPLFTIKTMALIYNSRLKYNDNFTNILYINIRTKHRRTHGQSYIGKCMVTINNHIDKTSVKYNYNVQMKCGGSLFILRHSEKLSQLFFHIHYRLFGYGQ